MIAVAGATGFVGRAVCDALTMRGIKVVTIGRRAGADIRWPTEGSGFSAADLVLLGRTRAVVNLTGESIAARWTSARKRAIRESRAGVTRTLSRAIASIDPRPRVLLSGSAIGFYGDRGDDWLDETAPAGSDFLATVAREWEEATTPAAEAGARVVLMRLGVVFGPGGGMLSRLRLPFSLGAGARLGDGRQWMSWIALDDVVSFVMRAIDDEGFSGPVNVTTPTPVTNAEFTELFAGALGRRAFLSAPRVALRLRFGEMADGVLFASQRARPASLESRGFAYALPDAKSALRAAVAA
jgi:uncharacterized protein (TIGR01777 family)